VAGLWFSPGTPVSFTNKTDCHDIAEILLKVALHAIKPNQTPNYERFIFVTMETCFKDLIIFNNDIFFNDFAFQPFDFECP